LSLSFNILELLSIILGSGLATYLIQKLEGYLNRPKLKVRFDYSGLNKEEVTYSGIDEVIKHKFVKVSVENEGKTRAEDCEARAEIISNGTQTVNQIKLLWEEKWTLLSLSHEERLITYLDISKDIDYLIQAHKNELFKPIKIYKNASQTAWLIVIERHEGKGIQEFEKTEIKGSQSLELKKDDRIKVTITCHKATSKSLCLQVHQIPIFKDINEENKGNYFKEIPCP